MKLFLLLIEMFSMGYLLFIFLKYKDVGLNKFNTFMLYTITIFSFIICFVNILL